MVALLGQSMPTFWLGIMLILLFSVQFHLLPSSGRGTLEHLILPAVTLGLFTTARITRLTRSGMLEVLSQDYIRTARAKGVSDPPVVWKHALKNAAIPIVTIVGIELGTLLGGSVITETIFAWPGVGRLSVQAIANRDYPGRAGRGLPAGDDVRARQPRWSTSSTRTSTRGSGCGEPMSAPAAAIALRRHAPRAAPARSGWCSSGAWPRRRTALFGLVVVAIVVVDRAGGAAGCRPSIPSSRTSAIGG